MYIRGYKNEKLERGKITQASQGAEALREYADSDDGFEVVHKYAYRTFTKVLSDIYDKFEDKYDLDIVGHALEMAVTDAFDDFQ